MRLRESGARQPLSGVRKGERSGASALHKGRFSDAPDGGKAMTQREENQKMGSAAIVYNFARGRQ